MRAALTGLARHRLLYPALRARPATLRTPSALLGELGFAADDVARADVDYERAAAELFPRLLERARDVGSQEQTDKLSHPELPAHLSKRLVYAATRLTRPDVVVETGTFSGGFSTFILKALEDNGTGRLVSLDVPAYEPVEHAIHYPLPAGQEPGWLGRSCSRDSSSYSETPVARCRPSSPTPVRLDCSCTTLSTLFGTCCSSTVMRGDTSPAAACSSATMSFAIRRTGSSRRYGAGRSSTSATWVR